jgi:DNA-binding NarL/FixJ family response regulator
VGINRSRLEQAIRELGLPVVISRDERDADAMLVLKSLYRTQPERVETAQRAGVPIYVLRGSSIERLREALAEMFRSDLPQTSQSTTQPTLDE